MAIVKKVTAKKAPIKAKKPVIKSAVKKVVAKKAPIKAKKPVVKSAVKKVVAKKAPIKAKKPVVKSAVKKVAAKKAPIKAKKPVVKSAVKKVATKKVANKVKSPVVKKIVSKKVVAKKTIIKKVAPKKIVAKPPTKIKAVSKKTIPVKSVVKKTPVKKESAKPVKSTQTSFSLVASIPNKNQKVDPTPVQHTMLKTNLVDLMPNYEATEEEISADYMNEKHKSAFYTLLNAWKQQLMTEVDRTVEHIKDETGNFADPADRASQEEGFSLELRARDRERNLIKKIEEAIRRLDEGEYGYCEACGVEIGYKRLEARLTATLCIDCKTVDEIRERQLVS